VAASHTEKHCCFCFELTDIAADGVAVLLSRPENDASQEVFAHVACMAERLHPRVPFDGGLFAG
jgi:hypothetical protein